MKKIPVKYKNNLVGYTDDECKEIDFVENEFSKKVIEILKNKTEINISSIVSKKDSDKYEEHNLILNRFII